MKRIFQATIISALLLGAYAQAATLSLSPGDEVYNGSDCGSDPCGPGNSSILAWLDANVDGFDSSNEAYKSDEDGDAYGDDSGPYADNFTTEFMNDIGDPADALISLNDGAGGMYGAEWLLVKDGGAEPIWYLFDISESGWAWDGLMDISLTNFWPDQGGISHVSIYAVPEPATLALFGIGLAGAGFSRRKKAKAQAAAT